jgi:pyruvate dehydrogenase (quinone)
MSRTVSDFLVERLYAWGVRRVFGYPGDGINGVMGALNRADGKIDFIQVRHEEMASFMATAHAKFTGELAVCMATSGPGATHLMTGMYDAREDHMPLLAIVGQQARTAIGAHYQQELDLQTTFKDVARAFVETAMAPAQMRHLVDRAIRTAISERAVTAIIFPNDLQEMEYEEPERAHGFTFSGIGYTRPKVVPYEKDLRGAAEILNAGRKVAMLVGAGCFGAEKELVAVADKLGAGCAKALLGKAVLSDELPWVTGSIGLLGTKASWDLMMDCDTLLMVGTGFPWAEFLPKEGQAKAVQIDIKPEMLALRYPVNCPLHGDAAETLKALLPMLDYKTDRSWRERVEGWVKSSYEIVAAQAREPAKPINPQLVVSTLSERVPERAIVTSDSGSCANWYARDLKMRRGMMGSLSGSLASMGAAVPYAIAAKFAHPDRPVIALVGDGAMQMNNMAELITLGKYWDRFVNKTWVVCVFNNQDLNQVTWEQRIMNGDPKYVASQDIPNVPYADFGTLIGFKGIFCNDPAQLGEAWDEALRHDRPVVLEVKTDPEVPPLPPHITFKEARNFMSAIVTGDQHEGRMIAGAARQLRGSVMPGGSK